LAVVVTTFWAAVTLPSFADYLGEVSVYSIQVLAFFSSICCCFCEVIVIVGVAGVAGVAAAVAAAVAAMLVSLPVFKSIAAAATTLLRATSQLQRQLKEYK
jgi:hypothetical protein